MSKWILIVDDEVDIANTLSYNLEREGFRTTLAHNGADALRHATTEPYPDAMLLDLMLPDMSGTEICRQVRAHADVGRMPILMLTAKGEEIDRVVGFEVGADDYIVKPFSVREILLRLRAVLRRSGQDVAASGEEAAPRLRCGAVELDPTSHRAWVHDREIQLTALEFRLLQVLLQRQGRVQTRDVLLHDVWGIDADVTTRTVDTHVKRLRQKLGESGQDIETLRGVGYRLLKRADMEAAL